MVKGYGLVILVTVAVLFGAGVDRFATGPMLAARANEIAMPMEMHGLAEADREMNAAMSRMMRTMQSMKMTGEPDRDFMTMMIPHHQAAIDMANVELRRGNRPLVKGLARDIIAAQQREIKLMHKWLNM